MHENYKSVKNRDYEIETEKWQLTQDISWETLLWENPTRMWGFLFPIRKWIQVKRSKAYFMWDTIIHKPFMGVLSLSLFANLLIYGKKIPKKEWNPFSS